LDQGCKGTLGHNANLYKVKSDKEVMKHFHGGLTVETLSGI